MSEVPSNGAPSGRSRAWSRPPPLLAGDPQPLRDYTRMRAEYGAASRMVLAAIIALCRTRMTGAIRCRSARTAGVQDRSEARVSLLVRRPLQCSSVTTVSVSGRFPTNRVISARPELPNEHLRSRNSYTSAAFHSVAINAVVFTLPRKRPVLPTRRGVRRSFATGDGRSYGVQAHPPPMSAHQRWKISASRSAMSMRNGSLPFRPMQITSIGRSANAAKGK